MIPTSYDTAHEIAQTRRRKLANNIYLNPHENGSIGVRLHETDVAIFYPDGRTVLDSGGWRTATTKDRINAALPSPWQLYQERSVWYLTRGRDQEPIPYADGITLHPDGTVTARNLQTRTSGASITAARD